VLIGTVIFLSLIVLLLAMPVTVTYQFSWRETPAADVRLNWAFGLVRADVSPDPSKLKRDKPEAAHEKAAAKRKSKSRNRNVVAGIRQPSFRRRILRFVSDVWHAIHKKNVELYVRLGLGDPADTGQLWAVLGPLSGMAANRRDIRVAIEPDFLDATLEVDSSGTIRVVPLRMVIIVFGLLVSPPIWRGVMAMRASG
jgi:hypothetical protein